MIVRNNLWEDLTNEKKVNLIRKRHRLLQYVDSDGVIIKKQSGTVLKYCDYLYSLIQKHDIYAPYSMLNVRDKELLSVGRIDYNTGYSRMTDFLRRIEVLELTDGEYSYWSDDKICQEYTLNIDNFVDLYEDAIIREKILYPGMFHEVSADYVSYYWRDKIKTENTNNVTQNLQIDYSCFNRKELKRFLYRKYEDKDKRIPLNVIRQSDFYKNNLDIFKLIEDTDYISLTPTVLSNMFTYEEEDMLASYASHCADENPFFQRCKEEKEFLNQYVEYPIKIQMSKNHYLDKDEENLFLKPSCRQFNDLCRMKNRKSGKRDNYMLDRGYDLSFDIHSTIFTLMRYMNTGIFDIEWDIKRIIYPDYDKLKQNEKWQHQFKEEVLMRCVFSQSLQGAWYGYSQNTPGFHFFKYDEFKHIYEKVQELTGGTKEYQYNIFLYESLWELLIMHAMVARGFDVANVYDCFYFKSSQTSVEEVKSIISEKVYEIIQ